MPIHFRCQACQQMLSVTRRKAGQEMVCPACGQEQRIPTLEEAASRIAAAQRPVEPLEVRPPVPADAEVRVIPDPAMAVGENVPAPEGGDVLSLWDPSLHDAEENVPFITRKAMFLKDELDMTSMVDVTFLLLVFFMITASFSVQKTMQSQPPEPEEGVAAAAAAPKLTMDDLIADSVRVEVGADDSLRVDDEPVAGPAELQEVLAGKISLEGKTEMVIEAEYKATHGMVVAVTDAGMQAGMQRVRRVSRAQEQ
jgi:biopolymer transport protein ExbD